MNDEAQDQEDWRQSLKRLRAKAKAGAARDKPLQNRAALVAADHGPDHGREALMTLVSIMKDAEDPRLQITAAKALLARPSPQTDAPLESLLDPDDIDAASALAKALLDELAARKAASLGCAGGVAVDGARQPDHPAG